MKIDKYEKFGKDKYRIFFNNGEVVETYDEVILKNNLLLKKEITSSEYQKIFIDTKNITYTLPYTSFFTISPLLYIQLYLHLPTLTCKTLKCPFKNNLFCILLKVL